MADLTQPRITFEDAFDGCYLVAYQAAFRVLGSRDDAEDVAQESMVRAFSRWAKVEDYVHPWLIRVATNLALDLVRRRSRQSRSAVSNHGAQSHVEERLDLALAIAELPRRQREVIGLRYIADVAEADVARLLGCSAGTVKQHAHRGLAALRSSGHLKEEDQS